jgi:hypothetical protein
MAGTTSSETSRETTSRTGRTGRTGSGTTTRSRTIGALSAVLATVLLVAGLTAPAAKADDGELRPRLEAACARVATAAERLDRVVARLDAPATERGSLAWFEEAIARATANGRPRVAADLQRRFDRLSERRAQLDVRSSQLDRFAARCAELGAGA